MGSPALFQWCIWCCLVGKTQHPQWCFDLHGGSYILGQPLQPKELEFPLVTFSFLIIHGIEFFFQYDPHLIFLHADLIFIFLLWFIFIFNHFLDWIIFSITSLNLLFYFYVRFGPCFFTETFFSNSIPRHIINQDFVNQEFNFIIVSVFPSMGWLGPQNSGHKFERLA